LRARASTSTPTASAPACGQGLKDAFPQSPTRADLSLKDLEERMLFIEAIETVKCVDEGVIESVADANIGSIFGIGFPAWTGGVLQYINGYEGGSAGLRRPRP
jgi:3-hydroxyacyl-CoA dehydrogenase/enoyl-CoA hydratase/3-hydroxybutyryl-CoA epimerase